MDDDGFIVGALLEISKSIILRDDGRFLNAEQSCHRIGESAKPSYATHRCVPVWKEYDDPEMEMFLYYS